MTYNFKRLAEVEEIQEAPETANAFVEVDGKVKRAPYRAGGGGAKIDDLRFNLDIREVTEGYNTYVNFTNMDQIKKVWDNDMNIVILIRNSNCCGVFTKYKEYYRCNTSAKLSGTSAVVPYYPPEDTNGNNGGYGDSSEAITVMFETEERLTPVSAKYRKINASEEIIAAYATI